MGSAIARVLCRDACRLLAAGALIGLAVGSQALAQPAASPPPAQSATGTIEDAAALERQATELYQAGRFAEAEPLFRRVLAIRERALGPEHPDTARSLNNLAEVLREQGRYADVEPLLRRALAIDEKALGPEHPGTARGLTNLASLFEQQDRYAEAEPLYRRALAIDDKTLGPEHADTATSLNNLAEVLREQRRYAEAEPLLRRALAIREKALGPENPDTATSVNDLALSLEQQGRYVEAEPLFRRALAISEKALGPDNPDTATSLNNLGDLLDQAGRYAEAEPLYRRALAIDEKALGPEHPDTAMSLNNLASLLDQTGRYAEAEPLYRRALAIDEKTLGPQDPGAARGLNNLASLLEQQSRYAEAEPLYRRALAIEDKALGPEHPVTATSLNNLGEVLEDQGRYAEAEPLLRRALAIREKALGSEHPDTARSLNNLAEVLCEQARYAEAEPLYRRALAISEKALGPNHPDTTTNLNNLAVMLREQGRYGEAAPLYRRALAIREQALGPEHPDTATGHETLGILESLQGATGQAVADFRSACAVRARLASGVGTSRVAKGAADSDSIHCSQYLARALWAWSAAGGGDKAQDRPPALQAEAFSGAQRSESSAAGEALAQASARTLAAKAGAGAEAVDYEASLVELDRLNDAFAKAAGAGSGDQQVALAKARDATEAKIASLEATLKAKAPLYWDYRSPQPIDARALQAAAGDDAKLLHANEAVVLWMVTRGKDKGLVFAVSKTGFVWAEIGLTGDEVKNKVDTLRFKIDPDSFSRGAPAGRRESGEPFDRATAHDLYVALLGDPKIQAVINGAGIDTLIIVPSGPLTSLPPSLLVVDAPTGFDRDAAAQATTHWLIRDKALAVLPAVSSLRTLRQLLPPSRGTADVKLLALADPDFKGTGAIPVPPTEVAATQAAAPPAAGAYERDGRGTDALQDLPPLYGTLAEGRALAQTLDPGNASALLLGPDASKTNLLRRQADGSLARTAVLVFSTHGLLTGEVGMNEPALALAHPPKTGADPSDDGLLKASEAAALTLDADWVVLSACNTAAGDRTGAEGLSGLARAFFHAGATTLLVSHWRVDDAATERLITETFRFRQGGKPKAQASRASILEMLDDPAHEHADPRYWAPFVVVGEPE